MDKMNECKKLYMQLHSLTTFSKTMPNEIEKMDIEGFNKILSHIELTAKCDQFMDFSGVRKFAQIHKNNDVGHTITGRNRQFLRDWGRVISTYCIGGLEKIE